MVRFAFYALATIIQIENPSLLIWFEILVEERTIFGVFQSSDLRSPFSVTQHVDREIDILTLIYHKRAFSLKCTFLGRQ